MNLRVYLNKQVLVHYSGIGKINAAFKAFEVIQKQAVKLFN